MEGVWRDVKFGWRVLWKNPAFTIVAALTLALGIGLNTATFSLVNAILFRPLPVSNAGELVYVYTQLPRQPIFLTHQPSSYPDYTDFRDQNQSFQSLAAYAMTSMALDQGEETNLVFGEIVSGNYFSTLGLRPAQGRLISEEDDKQRGGHPVVVLSHAAWQRRFGGDPGVIGRTVRLNGNTITIIGVAQPGFYGMIRGIGSEYWVPMQMRAALRASPNVNMDESGGTEERLDNRGRRWTWMVGRLRPGVTPQQADAEIRTIGERLRTAYAETNEPRAYATLPAAQVSLLPGIDTFLSGSSAVLMGVVGLLLLIACANVAGMLLARAAARRREIALRLTLGASRPRVIRQLLAESLLLALLGSVPAILLAYASNTGLQRLAGMLPLPFQVALELTLDTRVLLFTLGAAALTAVAFGLAPAFAASRAHLVTALKEEAGAAIGGARVRLRSGLVIAQVALSLVLLVSAGLSLRSLQNAHKIDPGFNPSGVVVATLAPGTQGYEREQGEAFFQSFTERLQALPGVTAATTATSVPLSFDINTDQVALPGRQPAKSEEWPTADTASVGPGYFATMGIAMVRGREFTERDRSDAPRVAIVNETFAAHFWPGEDPIGRQFLIHQEEQPLQVVGVARNGKYRTLGEEPRMYFYESILQDYTGRRTLVARAQGSAAPVMLAIRQIGRELDVKVPVTEISTLDEATSGTLLVPRVGAALFGLFGALGMVLAAVGLYGVIAYAVSQRTREIGIRVALGAQRGDILRLVLRQGLTLTAVGVGLGVAVALALTQALSTFLYGINARDPWTFAGVALFLTTISVLACWIPARRAARVHPMVALRYE